MKKIIFAGFLGLAGVMMAGVSSGTSWAQGAPEVWEVEIDIFSGMPNPVITLTAEELAQVKDRLGRARAVASLSADVTSVRGTTAGYRGMIIRGKSGANKAVSMDAEVNRGKILRRGPSARAVLDDAGINLERYLVGLAVARKALTAELGERLLKIVP